MFLTKVILKKFCVFANKVKNISMLNVSGLADFDQHKKNIHIEGTSPARNFCGHILRNSGNNPNHSNLVI